MTKGELRLVRCRDCGMIYLAELATPFADGSYYQAEAAPFYLSEDKLRGDFSPARYRREIRLLRRHGPAGRVLDVGCSTGGFLYHLNQTFPGAYQIYGMDVPSEATRHAEQKGIRVLPGSFLELQEPQFDAITFWAVLEHVAAPKDFLSQAKRLLHPGGICLVLVPNIRSLAVRILGSKYRYILPQHINYFSLETLARLVESAGLRVIRKTTTHFNPAVIWQDRRSSTGLVSDEDRARLLGQTNALKEHKALGPLRLAYAAAEKMLGFAGLADNAVIVARCEA